MTVISAGLALTIVICNLLVLKVFLTSKKYINAQVVYRVSLAFSDILVGLVVFPSFLFNLFYRLKESAIYKAYEGTNNFRKKRNNSNRIGNYHLSAESGEFTNLTLPDIYLNFIGFFTTITIIVSVNTLTIAAADRFAAIYRPLKYKTSSTTAIARYTSIAIWLISALIAVLPFGIDDLWYTTDCTTIVYAAGKSATIFYILTFCVQLLIFWFFTTASYVFYKKHSKKFHDLHANREAQKEIAQHIKLMGTLAIIACAFTITLIPIISFLSLSLLPEERFFEVLNFNFQNSINYFPTVQVFVTIIFLTNSLSNFFVYSVRDKRFRKSTKKLFFKNTLHKIQISNKPNNTVTTE